jgi:hypothetical protein
VNLSERLYVTFCNNFIFMVRDPGSDHIQAELIQAGGQTLVSVIHRLISSILIKKELPVEWNKSIIIPIH